MVPKEKSGVLPESWFKKGFGRIILPQNYSAISFFFF